MTSPITVGARLRETEGRPSGFDYMRIVLAVGVIVWHTRLIIYGHVPDGPYLSWLAPFAYAMVPMFFTLSGFLVAGSLDRAKTLPAFLGLRVMRILPALAAEVLLSALILGPLLTTLPLREYFTDTRFFQYFWNTLGEIHYYLPGVFADNPDDKANGQLWTVPYELVCYAMLSALFMLGIFRNRRWMLAAMGLYYVAQIGNQILRTHPDSNVPTGSTVLMSFMAGLLAYRLMDALPWSAMWCIAMGATSVALLSVTGGSHFVALPLAYVTVYLGLLNPPRNRIVQSGDYSYGLYLFGYPIQQTLYAASPVFHFWPLHMIASVALSSVMAFLSWHLIEKRVLAHKNKLKIFEAWYLQQPAIQTLRARLFRVPA